MYTEPHSGGSFAEQPLSTKCKGILWPNTADLVEFLSPFVLRKKASLMDNEKHVLFSVHYQCPVNNAYLLPPYHPLSILNLGTSKCETTDQVLCPVDQDTSFEGGYNTALKPG